MADWPQNAPSTTPLNAMPLQATSQWLWLLPAALALQPCLAAEEPQALTVDPGVAQVVEGLAKTSPSRLVRHVVYRTEFAPAGRIMPASASYESIGGNVWGISTEQTMPNGAIQTRTVSLCGLIDLVSASTSIMHFDNTVQVPIGHIFIPMGMQVTKSFASKSRTASLAVPEPSRDQLCSPREGGSFTYSTRIETEMPWAPVGKPTLLSNSFEWHCRAGAIETSGALEGVWPASHIPVTCESTNTATGKPVSASYAYLLDAGHYLKLGSVSEQLQVTTRYSSIEAANR